MDYSSTAVAAAKVEVDVVEAFKIVPVSKWR